MDRVDYNQKIDTPSSSQLYQKKATDVYFLWRVNHHNYTDCKRFWKQ